LETTLRQEFVMRRVSGPFIPALLSLFALALGAPHASAASPDGMVIPGMGPSLQRAAPQPAGAGLGGGFIEFVLTGQSGGARPARQPYVAPQPAFAPTQTVALATPEAREVEAEPAGEFRRQEVDYSGPERPGTIVIDTPRKFLFLVLPNGRAIRYGVGVGRPGFEWAGVKSVTRKAEWPDWTPPPEMLLRRPDLPSHMDGGPENPLGARALYLGSSMYRIHGTNEPSTIGKNVSSGCIRMMNEDVIDLYDRVRVGAKVIVI
jgi:lipoprotein-anchoring transpeptidase ErfK/SrfK